jgi:hypothetical protein
MAALHAKRWVRRSSRANGRRSRGRHAPVRAAHFSSQPLPARSLALQPPERSVMSAPREVTAHNAPPDTPHPWPAQATPAPPLQLGPHRLACRHHSAERLVAALTDAAARLSVILGDLLPSACPLFSRGVFDQ